MWDDSRHKPDLLPAEKYICFLPLPEKPEPNFNLVYNESGKESLEAERRWAVT
jgi:hypothetical protein